MVDALFSLTDPGDEVILTDPTYEGMVNRVRLFGAAPRFVPLSPASGEWRLDLKALGAAVTERTRVLFISSPSFPSGRVASEEEWEAITSICRERDRGSSTARCSKEFSSTTRRFVTRPRSPACATAP